MSSTTETIKSSSNNVPDKYDADTDAAAAAADDTTLGTSTTTTTTTTVPLPTISSITLPPSVPETTDVGDKKQEKEDNNDDDDDESGLFAIDFMFEGSQPSRMEHFTWNLAANTPATTQQSTTTTTTTPTVPIIQVALSIADDNPGAVQSGHYLWPAAKLLADYLVQQHSSSNTCSSSFFHQPSSVLELGAGCALLSLTALQLWQDSLQCVVVTDHDPGTLERARNNYESTLQKIMDASSLEEDWMDTINNLGSIPVLFESLAWSCKHQDNNNNEDAARIRALLEEHTNTDDSFFEVILGSDLIYDIHVVEPLLTTAARFLSKKQRQQSCCGGGSSPCFLLSQSFAYDDATEQEIDATCQKLGLQRKILWQEQDDEDAPSIEHEDQEKHIIEQANDMGEKKKKTTPDKLLSAKKRIQEFRWIQD